MSQYDPKLVRFYIDLYVNVFVFEGHNLDTFYSKKLKFVTLLTHT